MSWRVWGNRGNTVDFILTTFDTSAGTGGGPTLEDEDMVNGNGDPLQLNEDYEVYAACQEIIDQNPQWLNTLTLPRVREAADRSSPHPLRLVGRASRGGPHRAPRHGRRRVESPGSARHDEADPKGRLRSTRRRLPSGRRSSIASRGSLPVNTATPWQPTGGLGITTQYNMFMWFDGGLDPESAVILRLPDEGIAKYMGLSSATSGARRPTGPTGT